MFNAMPPKPKRRKRIVWLSPKTLGVGFLTIALCLLMFGNSEDQGPGASYLSHVIHYPVSALQGVRNFGMGIFITVRDNFNAKTKLAAMRDELETLRKENQDLRFKLRRHDYYREAFNLRPEEGMSVITATVWMTENRMAQSFIIDRGTLDGLDVNMPVLIPGGLVGRTTRKINQHASQVMPLTDPRSGIGVYVKGTPYEGTLRGMENGEHMLLTEMFLNENGDETIHPKPGDEVLTSGHGMVFPRDLRAGVISEATAENGLVVDPVIDFKNIKAVMIMTSTPLRDDMLSLLSDSK